MHRGLLGGIVGVLCASQVAFAQGSKQFIQAELLKTIKAKKAKVGDVVKARAVQAAILPGGVTIPEGSTLVGEVRSANENSLTISFDQAQVKGKDVPVKLSIRGAMMPGEAPSLPGGGSSSVESGTRGGRPMHGASAPAELPANSPSEGLTPGRNVAGQTGAVIGMAGVTLEVDEGPQHASKFASSEKELQLKSGLQLMLAVVE
jgi:hypothetical protein